MGAIAPAGKPPKILKEDLEVEDEDWSLLEALSELDPLASIEPETPFPPPPPTSVSPQHADSSPPQAAAISTLALPATSEPEDSILEMSEDV